MKDSLRKSVRASLSTSLRRCTRYRRPARKLDNAHSPVIRHKDLVSDPPDVRLSNLVDPVNRAEQLPPVVIARLIQPKRERQPLIRSQRADEVCLGARLD